MRIYLLIGAVAACVAGACFLVAGAALWLATRYGPLAADIILGSALVVIGGVIIATLIAARESASATASIPERVFENLGADELRGLGLLFESRPLLASGLALMIGLEKGMHKTKR